MLLCSTTALPTTLEPESHRRGVVIAELQWELLEREADLADEARAKLRLHDLNAKLDGVIRAMEEPGDAMVGLIDESQGGHSCGRSSAGSWLVGPTRRAVMSPSIADLLEHHGVAPPSPPLESFTKKALMAPVRQLLGEGQGCLKVILGSSRCSPSSLWRSQKASADRILLVARAMRCNLCPDFEAALGEG